MRKIRAMRRNRNGTMCYMVIRDSKTNRIEVWSQKPDGGPMTPIISLKYEWIPDAEIQKSEIQTERRAMNIADMLSRIAESRREELIKSLQQEYGRVPDAQIQTAS